MRGEGGNCGGVEVGRLAKVIGCSGARVLEPWKVLSERRVEERKDFAFTTHLA